MMRKGRLLVLVAGLLLVLGAGVAVAARKGAPSFAASGTAAGPSTGSGGPTATTLPVGERSVPSHVSTSPTTPLTASSTPGGLEPGPGAPVATDPPVATGGGNVSVTVTYSGWDDRSSSVQVSGLVLGVLEQGGVCTLSLTQGATTVTQDQPAEPDVSSTSCGTLSVPAGNLAPGKWRAVLAYRSASSTGTSGPVTVTVPAR